MSSSVLHHQALVALHSLEDMWLLYSPFSNIGPFLILIGVFGILFGVGWLPAGFPVICELLNEVTLNSGRLGEVSQLPCKLHSVCLSMALTVKVGSSMAVEEVDDSTAEDAELASSFRTDWASALTDPASRAAAESAAAAWKRMAEQQAGNRSDRSQEMKD